MVSQLTGKPVTAQNVSTQEYIKALVAAGFPGAGAQFFASTEMAIKAGELFDPHPGTLSKLISHPTTPLAEALAPAFAKA